MNAGVFSQQPVWTAQLFTCSKLTSDTSVCLYFVFTSFRIVHNNFRCFPKNLAHKKRFLLSPDSGICPWSFSISLLFLRTLGLFYHFSQAEQIESIQCKASSRPAAASAVALGKRPLSRPPPLLQRGGWRELISCTPLLKWEHSSATPAVTHIRLKTKPNSPGHTREAIRFGAQTHPPSDRTRSSLCSRAGLSASLCCNGKFVMEIIGKQQVGLASDMNHVAVGG